MEILQNTSLTTQDSTTTKRIYHYAKKTGRPMKYSSPDELESLADRYFDECDAQDRPYTVTGLALSLGMSREQLLQYQERLEFQDTIKRAKQRVAAFAEEQLYRKSGQVAGIIFSLKNNFGWKESFENMNFNINPVDLLAEIEKAAKPIRR